MTQARPTGLPPANLDAHPDEVTSLRHELRTPLSGMSGLLSLLLDSSLDDTQQHLVRSLQSATNHLSAMVDEVLSPVRFEPSGATSVSFDCHHVVEEVVALFAGQAATKVLHIHAEVDTLCPRFVWGDPIRLRQVLVNLVSNAVKFTHRGSVVVRAKATIGETCIRFEVADTGVGIDETTLAALAPRSDGSGIGLKITRNIVSRLGGRLVFASRSGRGTTASFSLELPSAASAHASPRADGIGASVLLVEDDDISQEIVRHILDRLGHRVHVVATGAEAVAACEREPFDVVLLDGHLPDMSGMDVVRQLRGQELRTRRRQPVVGLTATATGSDKARSLAAGMDGYLAKPATMAQLAATIDYWVERASATGLLSSPSAS